ncbi:MAG: ParB/RepB/Spo0J family partition protein [Alphaproteobacteria bacterium]|nr:ParB/RepB/Spo0J family partition protein [Alphaproteobacteria bacterium]
MAEETSRKSLGRGLSSLLGDDHEDYAALEQVKSQRDLPIEFLTPSPFQPRHRFDEDELKQLVASVREHGILQPILVRHHGDSPDRYEIIAGERRWRAAQLARLTKIPVIIKDFNDEEALEVALIENVQREDLTPIEEAQGYQRLIDEFEHTQEQVSKLIGRSRSHIANTLRLLNLPMEVREMLHTGLLTAGHGRALLNDANPIAAAKRIIAGGLNVRETEALTPKKRQGAAAPVLDADTLALERDLSTALGLHVTVGFKGEKKGGTLKIAYSTLDQLDDICKRLLHHPQETEAERKED